MLTKQCYLFLKKLFKGTVRFLELQGCITLLSLPVLVWWGIPLSLISPLGNLFFSPFITLFLAVSFTIFVTELFFLPNIVVIKLLEWITQCWLYLASWTPHGVLWSTACPAWYILVSIELAGLLIIWSVRFKRLPVRVASIWASCFLVGVTLSFWGNMRTISESISCASSFLSLEQNSGRRVLTDHDGARGTRSLNSWIDYTLIPSLIRATGKQEFDELILRKPTVWALKRALALCAKQKVKKISIANSSKMSPALSRAHKELIALAQEHTIAISPLT